MANPLFVAVCTDRAGGVGHAAGPFCDEADAKAYADENYGAQGYAAPFELVFRSPARSP